MDNARTYEALSYVWGPATPNFPILLNGYRHEVRINLLNFLIQTGEHDRIWIDALCVLQNNPFGVRSSSSNDG